MRHPASSTLDLLCDLVQKLLKIKWKSIVDNSWLHSGHWECGSNLEDRVVECIAVCPRCEHSQHLQHAELRDARENGTHICSRTARTPIEFAANFNLFAGDACLKFILHRPHTLKVRSINAGDGAGGPFGAVAEQVEILKIRRHGDLPPSDKITRGGPHYTTEDPENFPHVDSDLFRHSAVKPNTKRDFSLRRPTASQERGGKKERRPAPFEMTVGGQGRYLEGRGRW